MQSAQGQFSVRLAADKEDLHAAQRLRYRVFVTELGGDGEMVDHDAGLERDRFDPFCDHFLLIDHHANDAVVGSYRVMQERGAHAAGQFYSESEYDVSPLRQSGRKVMELGRSCVAPDYRGGAAMYHLWHALGQYIEQHDIEILFGVASFHGTDIASLAQPLSLLHHRHLAPAGLRVRALDGHYQAMNLLDQADIDRRAAMLQVPALIKAYLRLGGFIGEGAFIDHAFNTTDICLVMDTAHLNARQKSIYTKGAMA